MLTAKYRRKALALSVAISLCLGSQIGVLAESGSGSNSLDSSTSPEAGAPTKSQATEAGSPQASSSSGAASGKSEAELGGLPGSAESSELSGSSASGSNQSSSASQNLEGREQNKANAGAGRQAASASGDGSVGKSEAASEQSSSEAQSGKHASANSPAHATQSEHVLETGKVEANQSVANSQFPAHPASGQPLKLFGRIEELCSGTGAKIPLKMQAMTPIRDASLDEKNKTLAARASLQSFPIDYRGTWSGELTVWNANFDKSYWEFDPDEANKESQLLRRGTKGRCGVTFYEGANKRIELQPCEVVFTTTVNAADEMKQMMGASSPFGAMFAGGANPMIANVQVPYMYALHLGNLTSGTGVTGNQLNSQLMKNTLKELARGVVEQEVVTRDSDRNPRTGKIKTGYSESVLRFTRLDANRLYLQAASVSYRNDGRFQYKVILYGTLDRSSGAQAGYPSPYGMQQNIYASPYGAQRNPYGGTQQNGAQQNPFGMMQPGGAGAGAGALQQQMQQMQKLLQQMGGR